MTILAESKGRLILTLTTATVAVVGVYIHHRQASAPKIPLQCAIPQRSVHPEEYRYHFESDIYQALGLRDAPTFRRWVRMRWDCIKSSGVYTSEGRMLNDPEELRALIGAQEVFKLAMKRVAERRPNRMVSSKVPEDRADVGREVENLTKYFTEIGVITLL